MNCRDYDRLSEYTDDLDMEERRAVSLERLVLQLRIFYQINEIFEISTDCGRVTFPSRALYLAFQLRTLDNEFHPAFTISYALSIRTAVSSWPQSSLPDDLNSVAVRRCH